MRHSLSPLGIHCFIGSIFGYGLVDLLGVPDNQAYGYGINFHENRLGYLSSPLQEFTVLRVTCSKTLKVFQVFIALTKIGAKQLD